MAWFDKYYAIHDCDPLKIDNSIYSEISEKIKKKFSSETPVVSIVVIAYNEERNLTACLWSLSDMVSKYPIEIIGVNNNSSDRTQEVYKKCGIDAYIAKEYQSPGASRQCGLVHAKGKYYFCIDSDLLYPSTYIDKMMEYLDSENVVAACSIYSYIPDKKHSKLSLWIYEQFRDFNLAKMQRRSPQLAVRGAVFAHDLPLAKQIGYRQDIFRGEDGTMARKLMEHGKLVFVRDKEARAAIDCSHLGGDNVVKSLFARILHHIPNVKRYFFPKKVFEDQKENLSKKL